MKGTYRRDRGSWRVTPWGADGKRSLVIDLPAMLVVTLRRGRPGVSVARDI